MCRLFLFAWPFFLFSLEISAQVDSIETKIPMAPPVLVYGTKAQNSNTSNNSNNSSTPISRPDGVYNPATPPGGPGSENAQSRKPETKEQAAKNRQNYATQLKSIKEISSKYTENVSSILNKLNNNELVVQSKNFKRLEKYINSSKNNIDEILNLDKNLQQYSTIDYSTYPSVKSISDEQETKYKYLANNLSNAKIVEQFITNGNEIIKEFNDETNKRNDILSLQLAKFYKMRNELIASQSFATSDKIMILGITMLGLEAGAKNLFSIIGLLEGYSKEYLVPELTIKSSTIGVLTYSMKFVDELAQHWIENNKPIDINFLNETNKRALFAAGLNKILPEAYFVEKGYDTWRSDHSIVDQFKFMQDSHDFLVNQQSDILKNIDFAIAQTKKMQQINKTNSMAVIKELTNFMKSDNDYPDLKQITEIPILWTQIAPLDIYRNLNIDIVNKYVLSITPCNQINNFKSYSNSINVISSNYLEFLKHSQIICTPTQPAILASYYPNAKSNFENINKLNQKIQETIYDGQLYSNGQCDFDFKLLIDYNTEVKSYFEGIENIKHLKVIQQIFLNSEQDLKNLQSLVYERDNFYSNLILKTRSISGVITTNNSKPSFSKKAINSAQKKAIKQIQNYLNYEGTDILSIYFKSYSNSLIKKAENNDLINSNYVSSFIKDYVNSNTMYNSNIWLEIFINLEHSCITKLKSSNSTLSKNNLEEEFNIYYKLFLQEQDNHKIIFDIIDKGKVDVFQ